MNANSEEYNIDVINVLDEPTINQRGQKVCN